MGGKEKRDNRAMTPVPWPRDIYKAGLFYRRAVTFTDPSLDAHLRGNTIVFSIEMDAVYKKFRITKDDGRTKLKHSRSSAGDRWETFFVEFEKKPVEPFTIYLYYGEVVE